MPLDITPTRVFTQAEILTGSRNTRYYLDLLDGSDSFVRRLDGTVSGKLEWLVNRQVKGAGDITLRDVSQPIDWLTARVRPVMVIDGLPEQRLGVFLAAEAPDGWDNGRSWAVKLLDKTTILDQDIITTTYSVDAGTVVTTTIISIITGAGIANYAITPSAATLPGAMAWQAGTSKLRIINDLLKVIGYFALYANFDGALVGEPYTLPASRPILYELIDGDTSVYDPNFTRDVDIWTIPNRVVIVGQGDGTTAALTSSIDNTSASSPYSIANRGRVIGYTESGVEADSQATLDAYARRILVEKTTPTSSVQISHSPLPGVSVNNAVRFRRVPAGIDARHTVLRTTITLDGTQLATSELREVVDL